METQRQKKIGGVIQKDIVDILQRAAIGGGMTGVLISVSKVTVTTDLSIAKVYLSIFPNKDAQELMEGIKSNQPLIKHELSQRTKHQLRRVPELLFFFVFLVFFIYFCTFFCFFFFFPSYFAGDVLALCLCIF